MVNSVEKRLQFLKLDPQDGLLFKLNVWVSRLLVSAKRNAASAIYQFLDSRLTLQKFSPCLDSNRKGSLYSCSYSRNSQYHSAFAFWVVD